MTKSALHPVLYTTPNCMPCAMTKKWFAKEQIDPVMHYYDNTHESNEIDINSLDANKKAWSNRKIESFKSKYPAITSFPVVKVVDDNNNLIDIWGGFNPAKLRQWFSN